MEANSHRGQSSVIALVLIMALALATALLIATVGSVTLQNSQQYAETEKAVTALTELDSKASLVALGGGDGATLQLGLQGGGEHVKVRDSGRLRMVLVGGNNTTELTNTKLGTVEYANGDQRIAYQGGGVWRRSEGSNGSVMVSPPEVHYRQGTLTLPMVKITSDDRRISTAELREGDRTAVYPIPENGSAWRNPVESGSRLVLYVTSDYYRGWKAFFERRIGANTTVYPGNRTVKVVLVSPHSRFKLDSGLISVGTGSPIDMQGTGGSPTFVDSYNSTAGSYSATNGSNGTVRSPSGLDLGGKEAYVKGTINTGGEVTFSGDNNTIFGDAWHQGLVHPKNGLITGVEASNGTGVEIPPIDGTINQRVNAICANNTTDLGTTRTIHAGQYCHKRNKLTLNGDTLTVDVSGGDVHIAVPGDITLQNGGTIEVTGTAGNNNTVEVWVYGDWVKLNSGEVTVPGQESPRFRLYGKSNLDFDMQSQSSFVGLMYAPTDQDGTFDMQSKSNLYGAAVTGEVSMQSGSAVHYDQALGGFTFHRQGAPVSRLSYLYVTINEVEIEDR